MIFHISKFFEQSKVIDAKLSRDKLEPLESSSSTRSQNLNKSTIIIKSNIKENVGAGRGKKKKPKGELLMNNETEDFNKKISKSATNEELSASLLSTNPAHAKLRLVDHDKIYYQAFNKSFYNPSPDIASLSQPGIFIFI